ncbi:MAG: MFS transporter [Rhodospirillaceae bacterium]|nr:MFS transporter [Rhodospirillaceae bacterium]MBT4689282.1 MFS transporter [Rhodospirillaceae bacterium]MBT5079355.1 MFS transporter [Rhodospirillaceae bacterium]MBT7976183.1 MFS transporter [Rhodospirillaceae bacterium]
MIAASCFATFAITASGATRTPFLIQMAQDLDVSLGMIANLFGVTSIAWGSASFLAGIASDRMGRRPFLVGAPIAVAIAMGLVSRSESFLTLVIWSTLAGGCCGLYTGVSLAEVAGRVSDRQRARAIGWVMAGQSITLLIGVPMASWIGAFVGWRGVNLCVATLAVIGALAMLATTSSVANRAATKAAMAAAPPMKLRSVLTGQVLRLLGSVVAERICFGLTAVYYATFMLQTYDMSLATLAIPLAIFACGNIFGTLIGGQLGDRFKNRMLTFSLALMASGVVAIFLFGWQDGVVVSVVLGFAYMFFTALSRPSLTAALANVPGEIRGTVMGLNSTAASFGWLAAASLGGWLLSTVGFVGFGPLAAVLSVLGATLALSRRKE